MKYKLRDGRVIDLVPFNKSIPAAAFLKFINDIIEEELYIIHDRKYTLKEEKKWKKNQLEAMARGNFVGLVALQGKYVVANLEARRDRMKLSGNVNFGVAVAKDFRGVGLGEKMLRLLIRQAKKKFKPRNMYLTVIEANRPALSLYKKVGFKKEIGRFPKWFRHKDKFLDHLVLLYCN